MKKKVKTINEKSFLVFILKISVSYNGVVPIQENCGFSNEKNPQNLISKLILTKK